MNAIVLAGAAAIAGHPEADSLLVIDGRIAAVGRELQAPAGARVLDARQCVIWPGLVNTHHHLAQSLLKGVPASLHSGLGDWLAEVPYRFWAAFDPEILYTAAKVGLVETLESGVTTCADHHYLYHAHTSPELEDAVWRAADELGIRLVLCRGAATARGTHPGMTRAGFAPETTAQGVASLERSLARYHQPGADARRRLVVAPTSLVRAAAPEDLKTLVAFARQHHLQLHSHLLEVSADDEVARAQYGCGALDYAERVGFVGRDVWFAHLVQADGEAVRRLAQSGTGMAHCTTSNCRLGSGVAPAPALAAAGGRVGLGVDGSASSESGSMLQELNLAWLLHRAVGGPEATRPAEVLNWATAGGAALLGLADLGRIECGCPADLAVFDLDTPRLAGVHDTLHAPLLCGEPCTARYVLVGGELRVQNGEVVGVDRAALAAQARAAVRQLVQRVA